MKATEEQCSIKVGDLIQQLENFPADADLSICDQHTGYLLDFIRVKQRQNQPPVVQLVLDSQRHLDTNPE